MALPPRKDPNRPGETLTGIAKNYAVDIAYLVQANQLPDADHIAVGQSLSVPVPVRKIATEKRRATRPSEGPSRSSVRRVPGHATRPSPPRASAAKPPRAGQGRARGDVRAPS